MRRHYYIDLGLHPPAAQKDVERAFWRIREGVRSGRIDGEALRRAEEAYLVLSDPDRRRAYDRLLGLRRHPAWSTASPRSARNSFERCLSLAERGRYRQALVQARRAVRLDPGRALYRSYLGLLIARTGGDLREALREGRRAYDQDRGEPRIARNLSLIYQAAGMHRRASRLRPSLQGPFSRRSR